MNSVAYHCHGWLLCLFPIHRPLGFVRHDIACCCVTIRCMCISYRYVLVVVIVRIVGNSRSRLRQFDSVRCQYRILKILKLLISVTYGIKIINNTITTSTLVHDFYTTTTTSNNTDSNTNISVYCRRCHHHPTPTRLIVVMHRTAARHFTAPRRRHSTAALLLSLHIMSLRRCYVPVVQPNDDDVTSSLKLLHHWCDGIGSWIGTVLHPSTASPPLDSINNIDQTRIFDKAHPFFVRRQEFWIRASKCLIVEDFSFACLKYLNYLSHFFIIRLSFQFLSDSWAFGIQFQFLSDGLRRRRVDVVPSVFIRSRNNW